MINKILYKLSLLVGLFILLSGIFFKFTNTFSSGYLFRKRGNISFGVIDGNGAIVLALLILAFSFWMYKSYKTEKTEIDKKRQIERNEIALKNRGSS
jgi:hypothetical protein